MGPQAGTRAGEAIRRVTCPKERAGRSVMTGIHLNSPCQRTELPKPRTISRDGSSRASTLKVAQSGRSRKRRTGCLWLCMRAPETSSIMRISV